MALNDDQKKKRQPAPASTAPARAMPAVDMGTRAMRTKPAVGAPERALTPLSTRLGQVVAGNIDVARGLGTAATALPRAAASGYGSAVKAAAGGVKALGSFAKDVVAGATVGTTAPVPVAGPARSAAAPMVQRQMLGAPDIAMTPGGPASLPAASPAVAPSLKPESPAGANWIKNGWTTAAAAAAPQVAPPAGPKAGDLNTFTGSNGVVRTIAPDGALTGQGSQPQGSFQTQSGAPVATNGQPMLTGATPTAAPAGNPQYQAQVASAQARNLATNARANQVSAGDFGAPDLGELRRRFAHEMQGSMTPSARRALGAQQQDILRSITGSQQIAQQGAEGAIAQGNQTAGAFDVGAQQGQSRLAERGLINQGALDQQGNAAAIDANAAQQFTDAQGNVFMRQGTALTPVTGPDGVQARAALQADGQITPALALEEQGKALAALDDPLTAGQMTPEQRAAREAAIRQQFAPYLGQQPAAPAGAPSAGAVRNGYRFKGGDPNNKANWEKAQ